MSSLVVGFAKQTNLSYPPLSYPNNPLLNQSVPEAETLFHL